MLSTRRFWRLLSATALTATLAVACGDGGTTDPIDDDPPTGDVLLQMSGFFTAYDLDSFGRRLIVTVEAAAGNNTAEECSEVDPQNVVMVLGLPAGVSPGSETQGGSYDATAGTLTWELGTLDHESDCWGAGAIEVAVDVGPSIADGETIDISASVTTTTAGDDPQDNQRDASLQVGYLPVQVSLYDIDAYCDTSESDFKDSNDASVSCEGLDPGSPSGVASSSASYQPENGAVPREVGVLTLDGNLVALEARASASATSGYECTISSCATRDVWADASMRVEVRFVNPNPYDVPLRTAFSIDAGASCVGPDSDAEFTDLSVQCGSGTTTASGTFRLVNDGSSDGVCEIDIQVSGDDPRNEQDTRASGDCVGDRVSGFAGVEGQGSERIIFGMSELFADAKTQIVVGSGGTVEEIDTSEGDAFAISTLELRLAQ
ncbi:MAG TPA: hypothetical protein VMN78_01855 [Longimicrobiales bacterium]|nr:hypothetical protein [Longimicrobiales bacterium]